MVYHNYQMYVGAYIHTDFFLIEFVYMYVGLASLAQLFLGYSDWELKY